MVSILSEIFKSRNNASKAALKKYFCANCNKEIDYKGLYLRFTGEFLHSDCLIKYMKKLNFAKVVILNKSGEKFNG